MNNLKKSLDRHKSELLLLAIFVIVFLFIGINVPGQFLTASNIKSMVVQMPELGILAIGMMAIILTGGINLSVATTASLSGILAAFVLSSEFTANNPGLGIILAVLIVLVSATAMGVLNGLLAAYVGVVPLLVTLGTTTLFEGIGLNLTEGGAVSGFPLAFMKLGSGSILGIPLPLIIYIIVIIISYILLERTVWGHHLHMLGSNPVAAQYSGVDVKQTTFKAYLFSAILSGIAGMIMISRYNSAKIDYGSSYVMQSITAVVLGGTSIAGGHGKIAGTVIAVAIIQTVSTGLNIIGVDRNVVDITIGAILIVVLAARQISLFLNERKLIKERNKLLNRS